MRSAEGDIDMTESLARQIVLAARPKGRPQPTDLRLEETSIPTPASGQLLLGVQYLSLDPYMRGRMDDRKSYAKPVQLGDVMTGEAVAQVLASKHPDYAEGDIVLAPTGWRTHALSDGRSAYGQKLRKLDPAVAPVTTGLGVLGMPGFTAYGGMRVIGKPQPSETVVVAAASGPVGSLVGQLAKLAGARAVGIAGGGEKCAFVKDELRFDAAVDHRTADFPAQLAAACPNGIDVYFENVGGAVWQAVLPLLNKYARVPVSGLIAQYNGPSGADGTDRLPATMREVLSKSLTVRGFINYDFAAQHYADFLREVGARIADGSIRYREDIIDGLENAPEAFIGMLDGRNFGKLIVRVATPT
jgi:NADPH-dependent curcumin reductase